MVLREKCGQGIGQIRTRTRFNSYRIRLICGIACLIVGLATTVHPALPAEPEPRPINDMVKFLDIQIPGWQRNGNPRVVPIVDKDTSATLITASFQSNMQIIRITLVIPGNETVDKIMNRVSKEYAQHIKYNGFEAIKVTPPITEYEEYNSSLTINVADRYVLAIVGEEVLNPDTLLQVADLIDLKNLAATPTGLTKK